MHFENFTNRTQHNSTRYQNQQSLPRMMRLPSPYSHKILFYLINSPEVVCQVQNHHYHFRPFAVALCTTTLSIIVSRGSTPSESSEITLHVSGAGCKLCTPERGPRASPLTPSAIAYIYFGQKLWARTRNSGGSSACQQLYALNSFEDTG